VAGGAALSSAILVGKISSGLFFFTVVSEGFGASSAGSRLFGRRRSLGLVELVERRGGAIHTEVAVPFLVFLVSNPRLLACIDGSWYFCPDGLRPRAGSPNLSPFPRKFTAPMLVGTKKTRVKFFSPQRFWGFTEPVFHQPGRQMLYAYIYVDELKLCA
jgi:hypothetical protein